MKLPYLILAALMPASLRPELVAAHRDRVQAPAGPLSTTWKIATRKMAQVISAQA